MQHIFFFFFTVLSLLSCISADATLHLVDDVSNGAACLDGSAPGFYLRRSSTGNANWLILMQGGGWCYNVEDCYHRSLTSSGSSNDWSASVTITGMGSADCSESPLFCDFNVVIMQYCDGTSFSSDLQHTISHNGSDLHFRGKRNYAAILSTLSSFGLNEAENVLFTGCSAGAMSAYLHSNSVEGTVRSMSPSLKTFKTAPGSGLFLDHVNTQGRRLWTEQLKQIVDLSNMTAGLDAACVAKEGWRCAIPVVSYEYITAPVFVINSAVDSYAMQCMVANHVNFDDAADSGAYPLDMQCNIDVGDNTLTLALPSSAETFVTTLRASNKFSASGNGAFVHTCFTHCAEFGDQYNQFVVGGVALRDAVAAWWHSVDEDAVHHVHLQADVAPEQWEQTCSVASSVGFWWYVWCSAAVLAGVLCIVMWFVVCMCQRSNDVICNNNEPDNVNTNDEEANNNNNMSDTTAELQV